MTRKTAARRVHDQLVITCTDARTGLFDLRTFLHLSTREQDAATEMGWTEYADELLTLAAAEQTAAELGQL